MKCPNPAWRSALPRLGRRPRCPGKCEVPHLHAARPECRRSFAGRDGHSAPPSRPGAQPGAPAFRPAASRGGHSALTICHRQIVRARLIPGRAHCDLTSRTAVGGAAP